MAEEERLPDTAFLDHLEALRRTVLRTLAAVALLFAPALFAAPRAIALLTRFALPDGLKLHYFSPFEAFVAELKFALLLAFAAAFPYAVCELWRFLLPALYRRERRVLGGAIVASALLFYAGAAFAVLLVLPPALRFAAGFAAERLTPLFGLASFLELAAMFALAFGIMFQLPLAVQLSVRFGLVQIDTLRRARPYVVVGLLIFAAILTPPDVASQLMLFFPSYLLFEAGLFAARFLRPCGGGK